MCGLVGVAGNLNNEAMKVFHQLLVVDQLRGQHSTGIAHVTNWNDEVEVVKAIGTPDVLMDTGNYEKVTKRFGKCIIGHNRFATQGKVSKANAHPFDFDGVVGAHNGTLRDYAKLPGYGKFDVDSEVLYHAINEWGIDKAIANIAGAYCLTFFDKNAKTLNFLRNSERPLYIAEFNKGETIAWASEELMLEWILERNLVVADEVYKLAEDVLITIDLAGSCRNKLINKGRILKGGTELTAAPVTPFRGHWHGSPQSQNSQTVEKTEATWEGAGGTRSNTATTTTEGRALPNMSMARQTGAIFRIGSAGMSPHGAEYLACGAVDDDEAYRLYINKNNPVLTSLKTGDFIIADTNGMEYVGNLCVYRILASSVKALGEVEIVNAGIIDDDDGIIVSKKSDEEDAMLPDANGKYLARADWVKQHAYCQYCSGNIDPDSSWRFINREIICDECAENPVVKDYLSV